MTELSPTARWAGWVWRMQQGPGGVPAPGPVGGRPMQWIDVRDLAEFTIARCEVAEERVLAKEGGEERQWGPKWGRGGAIKGASACLRMAMSVHGHGHAAQGNVCTWPYLYVAMSAHGHVYMSAWPCLRMAIQQV